MINTLIQMIQSVNRDLPPAVILILAGATAAGAHLLICLLRLPGKLRRRARIRNACDAAVAKELCAEGEDKIEAIIARAVAQVPPGWTILVRPGENTLEVHGGKEGSPGKITWWGSKEEVPRDHWKPRELRRLLPEVQRELAKKTRRARKIIETGAQL